MAPVRGGAAFRPLGRRELVDSVPGGHPALYPGEAAYPDRQVDRLLGFLDSRGLLERTFVAVVADHGESLGEHDILHQHLGLYEPSVHVPLTVRWPDGLTPRGLAADVPPGAQRGRRFRGLVQTVDRAPSLLAASGLGPGPGAEVEGADLWDWVGAGAGGGRAGGRPAVVAEHANREGAMIRTRRYKYVAMSEGGLLPAGSSLFDLAVDPGETIDLAGRGLAVEERLARALAAWQSAAAAPGGAPRVPPAEELASLRALGYVD
jgi:arylsulfatase A-like enzyme